MYKVYLSRAQTRAWSLDMPIGDPTGGSAYGEFTDPMTAAMSVGGWVLGSVRSSNSASDAADTAAQASGAASAASIAEQRRQYDLSRADYAPYLAAGTGAVNRLGAGVAAGGEFGAVTPFDFQYDPNADPSTVFRFNQGRKALERSAASRGGILSGEMLTNLTRFGQDMASQEYQNAFNRYTTGFNANTGERNQLYNRLAGVAGTGQNAVGSVTAQGANTAGNIGNAYMTNAANTGNAAMAAAGIRNSAYGGVGNVLGRMYGNYGRSPYGGGGGGGGGGYAPVQEGSPNFSQPDFFDPYQSA